MFGDIEDVGVPCWVTEIGTHVLLAGAQELDLLNVSSGREV